MNKKIILSHSGKQHAYHVAKSLFDLGYLEKFYTSSYVKARWLQELIGRTGNKFWSRRFLDGLSGAAVESNWRFEIPEMIYGRLYGQGEKTVKAVYARDVSFDRYIARRMPQLRGEVFWGFQGSCHASLQAAKEQGKKTVCELAIAHAPFAKKILEEEKELHPEWADSVDNISFPAAYYQRLCEEPHRADVVIGASEFTLHTLRDAGIDNKKLHLLPLGFEAEHIPYQERSGPKKGPLRLLYAGRISQRKGIKYLLEAMKAFSPEEVELHLIGHPHGSGQALKRYSNYILHEPLQQYELFKTYGEYDAFVLPTLFEGFGLVILEAMAAGLPVITTPHSIGPEIIEDKGNGFIVPIRNVEALILAIGNLLSMDEASKHEMRRRARASALHFTWQQYQQRLETLVTLF